MSLPSKKLPAAALLLFLAVFGFLAGGLLGGRVFNSAPGFDLNYNTFGREECIDLVRDLGLAAFANRTVLR